MPLTQTDAMSSRAPWFWRPNLIVFVSSACVMTLELVMSRMLAPYVGTSLHIWTVLIGSVMAGISLGNYVGGRLADRRASLRLLGLVFVLSGVASTGIIAIDLLSAFQDIESITRETLFLIAGLGTFALLLFFLPCTLLGLVSPIVTRLVVRSLDSSGRMVGQIYAAGALGSIAGTFATGFFLISRLGTHAVAWSAGAVLIALGLLFLLHDHRGWLLATAWAVLVAASFAAAHLGWLDGPCTRETNYFCIAVRDEVQGGAPVRVLFLDRLLHSYSSLDDPTRLVYGYEQTYAEATAYQAQRVAHLSALFIGGGGYTFPRYMDAVYPGSRLDVIEIDPGVTEVAHDMLGLSRQAAVTTYNEDARTWMAREPAHRYDLIFGDAFNDFSVPYHLTTQGFNERVRAWLADDGLYVVNIIDGAWGHFLRAYVHTLRQTFDYVYPVFSVASWQQSSRSTIVILAGNTPLDLDLLRQTSPGLAAQLLSIQETDALLAQGRTVLLTDQYAPVDQMLLPVFLDWLPR